MLHFLFKLFPVFFYPPGLVFFLSITILVLYLKKYNQALKWVIIALVVSSGLFSNTIFMHSLVRSLEKQYEPLSVVPKASAIVLLGGATVPPIPPRITPETNDSGDRLLETVRLYKEGAAPYIIASGGKTAFIHDFEGSEALHTKQILTKYYGIPDTAVLMEDRAYNTRQNATYTKELLEQHNLTGPVLLVTSAIHMPRSVKIFEKADLEVIPAPGDYKMDKKLQITIFTFLPNADSVFYTTAALHEYFGMAAYTLMGWM